MKGHKILIMGLPGAGKTHLANKLVPILDAIHLNADEVRARYDDWDFSNEGRLRQADRMTKLADEANLAGRHAVVDFVCPTAETRKIFNPDFTIWVDTIKSGRFEDTNNIFVSPDKYDFRITKHSDGDFWPVFISKRILDKKWDHKHPTVQLLGRWQPWHEGHRALFERAIDKTGQVCVMVRDCHNVGDNPFDFDDVVKSIKENLSDFYEEGRDYIVHKVPNIVHITYGRTVGYTIAQEHFGKEVEDVSATKKREDLRKKGLLK